MKNHKWFCGTKITAESKKEREVKAKSTFNTALLTLYNESAMEHADCKEKIKEGTTPPFHLTKNITYEIIAFTIT